MDGEQLNRGARACELPDVRLFEDALPARLFTKLLDALRATGRERLKRNYSTTFWFPMERTPAMLVEHAIVELARLVSPGSDCVGVEWWLGRLDHGKKLRFHFDRDLILEKTTGQLVHPVHSSILFLNAFPSSPTIILDQVPGPDGKTLVPAMPRCRISIRPLPNHYVIYPGNLRHGVIPRSRRPQAPTSNGRDPGDPEMRLTLLMNYWGRRPLAPSGLEYDGTIYPGLNGGSS